MSFSHRELDEMVEGALEIAGDAGMLLLEGLGEPKQIEYKGVVDLVTDYDRRAEELIKQRLEDQFGGIPVLAEESVENTGEEIGSKWIVDPLDGTTNFSHGHPLFAVSIGLEDKGDPVAGVVTLPALGISAWARRGGGAFCNGKKIRVSPCRDLDQALIATGFPYDRRTSNDDNTREFAAFIKQTQGVRRCGAAAMDLVFLARGIYDGFFEPRLHPWDLAAGVVLLQEAGGIVTGYEGEKLDIYKGWIVASNDLIHDEMLKVIKEARVFDD